MGVVHPQHLTSKCEEGMIGFGGSEKVQGWSWKGGVHDDSEESACGALLSRPPHTHPTLSPVQFPCPGPTSAPAMQGHPMTHFIMDFGVLGRPSFTCLTLTPTTAAAVTCLVWARQDGRLTSRQVNMGNIHTFKTRARISQ